MRRVLITGIGLVTPLGLSTSPTWHSLLSGATAVRQHAFYPSIPVQIAAKVPRTHLPSVPPLLSPCPDFAIFALLAAREAFLDARLLAPDPDQHPTYSPDRAGVSIGVGMGHLTDVINAAEDLKKGRFRRLSPFLVPRILPNTPAGLVALRHGLRGPVLSPSSACAAGAHAVLDGFHAIRRGDVDVMVVGGSEAVIGDVAMGGFARARALAAGFNERPEEASRPFDRQREGFVLAEGAGVLLLESEEHVRKRGGGDSGGIPVYAEVVGGGMTGDGWHITSPPPDGAGAFRAMKMAVENAGRSVADVDYVNAHATSTKVGDSVERLAIAKLLQFSQVGGRAVVSSTKGATGHLLGGAGGVETAFVALTIADGIVPPTRNLEEVDKDEVVKDLGWGDVERYVPSVSREMDVNFALCNSFGFGGTNACIALARAEGFERKRVKRDGNAV